MFPGVGNQGNIVQLILKYVTDEGSKQKVQKDAQDVAKTVSASGRFFDPDLLRSMDESAAKFHMIGGKIKEIKTGQDAETQAIKESTRETLQWDSQTRQVGRGAMYVASAFQQIGQSALIAGGAITAGVVKSANDYIKSGVEVNEVTRAWRGTSNQIADENLRIGRVMAETVLPTYKALATFVGGIASFFEAHPAAAQAAALGGVGLTLLGALSIAVAQGVRLVADITFSSATFAMVAAQRQGAENAAKELIAAGLQSTAADKQIAAAGGKGIAVGAGTAIAGGGALATIGVVGGLGAAILAMVGGATIALRSFEGLLEKLGATSKEAKLFGDVVGVLAGPLGFVANDINQIIDEFPGALKGLEGLAERLGLVKTNAEAAAYGLSQSQRAQFTASAVDAFATYHDQEQQATRDNADKILQIKQDEYAKEQELAASNADAVARINAQFATQLANQYANFALQSRQAAETEALQRASIVANEGEQIVKIEHDLQKKLREMALEHDEKMYDLASARDALGLVREQRSYEQRRRSAIEDSNDQIKQLKRETAIRLKEEDARFALEQQHRSEDFNLQIQQETAAHADQLAEQAKQYAEQVKQAADQEKKKLEEQEANFAKEQLARRNAFFKQLNDLYYSLDQEAKLKSGYYQYMQADLENFLITFKDRLAAGMLEAITPVPAPTHDYTGYAGRGLYAMAQNGMPEFVLSGQATRAAEQMLGGRLNERVLLAALSMGGMAGGSVTWNDHRRFDGDVGAATRRATRQDTLKILDGIFT